MFECDLFGHRIDDFLWDDVLTKIGKRQLEVNCESPGNLFLRTDLQVHKSFSNLAVFCLGVAERLLDLLVGDPTLLQKDFSDLLLHASPLLSGPSRIRRLTRHVGPGPLSVRYHLGTNLGQ